MIIEIAKIPPEGKIFTGEEPHSILDVDDGAIRAESPIYYNLEAHTTSTNELIVRGHLKGEFSLMCSRCGELFRKTLLEPSFECVREVASAADSVDLTGDIREAIILIFPNHTLCRPDCMGLCSQCGINLNTGKCSCRPPEDDRWGILNKLVKNI